MIIQHTLTQEEIKEIMRPSTVWNEVCLCPSIERINSLCCTCNNCPTPLLVPYNPDWINTPSIRWPTPNRYIIIYKHGEHILKLTKSNFEFEAWNTHLEEWVESLHQQSNHV